MRNFENLQQLAALAGQPIATSDWVTITQEQINQFAQATGDHQWIHVDPVRAQAGPFGAPIAHGFLTLSLLPLFFASAMHIEQVRMGVNYGLNRVRFVGPVPVGSRLRALMRSTKAVTNLPGKWLASAKAPPNRCVWPNRFPASTAEPR